MILRGAILSGKHVTLDVQRQHLSAVAHTTAAANADVTTLWPSGPSDEIRAAAPADLSLDSVSAWLITADVSKRAALAELLASDIEQVRSIARKEGFAAGHAEGLREAQEKSQQKTQSSLAAMETLVRKAEAAFVTDAKTLAEQCADIVAAAFAKIVGEQLGTRQAALDAVLEVLRRIKDEREVVIRVSTLDLPVLELAREQITHALAGRKFSLVSDARVATGGCIVESQLGSLDGRLELQLQAFCKTIRAAKVARDPTA